MFRILAGTLALAVLSACAANPSPEQVRKRAERTAIHEQDGIQREEAWALAQRYVLDALPGFCVVNLSEFSLEPKITYQDDARKWCAVYHTLKKSRITLVVFVDRDTGETTCGTNYTQSR